MLVFLWNAAPERERERNGERASWSDHYHCMHCNLVIYAWAQDWPRTPTPSPFLKPSHRLAHSISHLVICVQVCVCVCRSAVYMYVPCITNGYGAFDGLYKDSGNETKGERERESESALARDHLTGGKRQSRTYRSWFWNRNELMASGFWFLANYFYFWFISLILFILMTILTLFGV